MRGRVTARRIKRVMLNTLEPKYANDAQYAGIECAYDTPLAKIDMPAQGDSALSRDGDRIFVDYIKLQGIIVKQADNGDEPVRLCVFRWNMDDGITVPVLGDVLDTATWGSGTAVQCPYVQQRALRRKFNILYDRVLYVRQPNGATFNGVRIFKMHLRVKKNLLFQAGAQTGIGQYYMFAVTNSATASTVGPIISCRSVMRFRDV